jgi:hypothetical protein
MARLEELAFGTSVKGILLPGQVSRVDADDPAAGETFKSQLLIKELIACRHLVLKTAGQRLVPGVQT